MKKITIILLLICGLTYSQSLTVQSGASLTIEKTGSATVGGNFSNSGTVTMNSDSIDTLNANVSMNDQFIKSNIASTYLMINSCCKIFLRDFEFKTVYNTW